MLLVGMKVKYRGFVRKISSWAATLTSSMLCWAAAGSSASTTDEPPVKTSDTLLLARSCMSVAAVAGISWSSSYLRTSLCPLMPPAALISAAAMFIPPDDTTPNDAADPLSGIVTPMV